MSDDPEALGRKWLERIRAATEREERWIASASRAQKAFLCDEGSELEGKVYEFNIFHSNIETLAPAVFNSSPEPDIRERFRVGRETPEAEVYRLVAQIYERAIRIQVDDGRLTKECEAAVQDALVAGRGILRVRFDADEVEQPVADEMGMPVFGEDGQPVTETAVQNERIRFEAVSWQDYREGPAKRWENVPWVAYRHSIPEEEVERLRDPAMREKLAAGNDPDAKPVLAQDDDGDVCIWEIWDRDTRRVLMMVEHSAEILSVQDDPLGLAGFFPQPAPIEPILVAGSRTPVTPFAVYEKLATELELITRRIRAITAGIKVKAAAAGNLADLAEWADADDNTVTAIANLEGLAQTGGIDKALAWWPIEQAITVLRELYAAREATKQMIYEITGISDIVRGQGKASETATAQEIKTQWGSLRIRKLQRTIEACTRDVFVICAEIMATKFQPQSLVTMTGVQVPPEAMGLLAQPLDHYRIDVESNSTIKADLSERRAEMGGFLTGTGAFFQTMAPLVMQSPQMALPVAEMFAAFARQFSLGKQAEDALENMAEMARQAAQQPQDDQPSPEEIEAQAKAQEVQMQAQLAQQEFEQAMQQMQAQAELDRQKMAAEAEKMQATVLKINADIAKIMAQAQASQVQADATVRVSEAKMAKEQADG